MLYVENPDLNRMCIFCDEFTQKENMYLILYDPNATFKRFGIYKSCKQGYGSWVDCKNCKKSFSIDYRDLKSGDKIMGGYSAFCYCDICLVTLDEKYNIGWKGANYCYENIGCSIDEDKNDIQERTRILGEQFISQIQVSKKIQKTKERDRLKGFENDLTPSFIVYAILYQEYKCYICNEKMLTEKWNSNCCYQFTIDAVNSNKPHTIDNVLISCAYCNSRHDTRYTQELKICDEKCHTEEKILEEKKDYYTKRYQVMIYERNKSYLKK